ncbi:MAG: tetratricopeptide repeat protein [Candidatus Cyclonatronum sp.]|uniref:tetratricopeptide repeat protein n=1 Tax=Cyclonatronum sp. TaxID=3024185 RepID=UPI0025BE5D42|nr:tetratricopeptide repeat protein [Cyclonatronum sp.]MCH8486283.1 tetratricopeptide repeat protein [Cyclonatronum sp.]
MADYELKDIRTDILEPSQTVPVVLDFWAPWCGPCRTLGPVLEKLAAKANGKWKFVKVNVDAPENQQIAAQFQIRSIPAVRMLFQGKLLGSFEGSLSEAQVKQWLSENLPDTGEEEAEEDDLNTAKLIETGNREAALALAKQIYDKDQKDHSAITDLAMLLLPDDIPTAEKLLAAVADSGKFEIERESLQTLKALQDIATGKTGISGSGKAAEQYKVGAAALFAHDYDQALENFISVLMTDRSFEDDGARKACVAVFKLLTDAHPSAKKYRRRFSMALY